MYKKFKLKFILWDFYRTGSKNVKDFWTKGFRTFILFVVPLYRCNSNNLNGIALISSIGGMGYFNFGK